MSSVSRLYSIPDADLLQAGEIIALTLPDDIASFTAFDSTITSSYPDTLRTALGQARSIRTDDVVVQDLADFTQAVYKAHADCYTAYKTLAYFVRKSYAGNTAMQRKFGLAEIRNAVNNQNKFIRFMQDLAVTALEYQDVLVSNGCSADLISNLPALAQALLEADRAQEKFKKDRGQLTQDRVGYLNNLYLLLDPLDEVAQIIFRNDTARMAKYMLPRPPKPSVDEPVEATPAAAQA
ncbi:MAG: hypothetical protein WCR72_08280 [Bacteroidota bacterium]